MSYSRIMGRWTTREDSGALSPTTPQQLLLYRVTSVPFKLRRIPLSGFSDARQTQSSLTQTCLERLSNVACTTRPDIFEIIPGFPWLVSTFINE
jgi:hypothetical protein